MEDTSVLRLFLTTLLLLSAATTDICGCGDACGGRDQGWPTDFAVDEAEETVKLRCYTGCTEEASVSHRVYVVIRGCPLHESLHVHVQRYIYLFIRQTR